MRSGRFRRLQRNFRGLFRLLDELYGSLRDGFRGVSNRFKIVLGGALRRASRGFKGWFQRRF